MRRRYIDVAVNLTDCVFRGVDWKGKRVHDDDLEHVIARARAGGVEKIVISGTSLSVCRDAVALCKAYPGYLYCTIGIHPAHADDFVLPSRIPPVSPRAKKAAAKQKPAAGTAAAAQHEAATEAGPSLSIHDAIDGQREHVHSVSRALRELVTANRDCVAAFGEIGLDHTELEGVARTPQTQREAFFVQLDVAAETGLPLFLHSRACGMAFVDALKGWLAQRGLLAWPTGGVVHSFNGTADEAVAIVELGMYIGINASAFRTEESARAAVLSIPLERLVIETDAPWCDVRPGVDWGVQFVQTWLPTCPKTAFVAGSCVERRNEPAHIVQVAEMLYGARVAFGVAPEPATPDERTAALDALADVLHRNAVKAFPLLV